MSRVRSSPSESVITGLINELFAQDNSTNLPRLRPGGSRVEIVIDGIMYRFAMDDANDRGVWLQVYLGLSRFGGQLWQQDVRAMLRVSATGSTSGLAQLIEGGVHLIEGESKHGRILGGEDVWLGYVVTRSGFQDVGHPRILAALRQKPELAVRHFGVLLRALIALHTEGVYHRGLGPRAVEVDCDDEPDAAKMRMSIGRFEMSGLATNLLRRLSTGDERQLREVRRAMRGMDPGVLCHLPPEHVVWLLDGEAAEAGPCAPGVHPTGDMFSLAMIASRWFGSDRPGPAAIPTLTELRRPFRRFAEGYMDWAGWRDNVARVRRSVKESSTPRPLADLLYEMLSDEPGDRTHPDKAMEKLSEHYEAINRALRDPDHRHYLVAISPKDFTSTVCAWEELENPELTARGELDLRLFIHDDLRAGFLEYCPGGYASVSGQNDAEHRRSCFVLHGSRYAYFGHVYRDFDRQVEVPQALMIRQVLDLGRKMARNYNPGLLRERLPTLRVLNRKSNILKTQAHSYPPWTPRLRAVEIDRRTDSSHTELLGAMEWLQGYHGALKSARTYAYELVEKQGERYMLKFDPVRDGRRRDRDPFLSLVAENPKLRPPFAELLTELERHQLGDKVRWVADRNGRPEERRGAAGSGTGVASIWNMGATDVLWVKPDNRHSRPPPRGWLRPADDSAADELHRRQIRALEELKTRPGLLGQLTRPRSFMPPHPHWRRAADGLEGETARRVVREMLDMRPFYAVQGPPGTGKTTIASRSIRAQLAHDRSHRILVSAQSNDAVDNLLERLDKDLGSLKSDVVILRIMSEKKREHSDPRALAQKYDPKRVSRSITGRVPNQCFQVAEERAIELIQQRRTGAASALRQLAQTWADTVGTVETEIVERLLAGANLVFATCAVSTARLVGADSDVGRFDWVLVEEAARAWPTELVIPLVRGHRWTLIGDHEQIGPFGSEQAQAMLDACKTVKDPELNRHGAREPIYRRYLSLFEYVCPDDVLDTSRARVARNDAHAGVVDWPAARLDVQFRMRPAIGELVSRIAYKGTVSAYEANGQRDHGLTVLPTRLEMLWVDTDEGPDCGELRAGTSWKNIGEAKVVERLVTLLRADLPERPNEPQLAVLTPYLGQHGVLLKQMPSEGPVLFTIDAYQGQEANVVIVSLVRGQGVQKAPGDLKGRLGHLAKKPRVNVMLSRARNLLIMVGAFAHFADSGSELWQTICETFDPLGRPVGPPGLNTTAARIRQDDLERSFGHWRQRGPL